MTQPRSISFAPLTARVRRRDVTRFRREPRSREHWETRDIGSLVTFVLISTLEVTLFIVVIVIVAGFGADSSVEGVVIPFVLFAAVSFVWLYYGIRAFALGVWPDRFRLQQFATVNGFDYRPRSKDADYPGWIFRVGAGREVTDRLVTDGVEIGNLSFVTGGGQTHEIGYLVTQLPRRLPNLLLESRADSGAVGSLLPVSFPRDQVLSLEGDFDRYFTLYAPKEYERDALYLLTPDVVALLIDEAAPFDLEIVDDRLFVYSARAFGARHPTDYERLFRLVDTVGAKLSSRAARYTDDRSGYRPTVDAPGRRLRQRTSFVSLAITLLVSAVLIAVRVTGVLAS